MCRSSWSLSIRCESSPMLRCCAAYIACWRENSSSASASPSATSDSASSSSWSLGSSLRTSASAPSTARDSLRRAGSALVARTLSERSRPPASLLRRLVFFALAGQLISSSSTSSSSSGGGGGCAAAPSAPLLGRALFLFAVGVSSMRGGRGSRRSTWKGQRRKIRGPPSNDHGVRGPYASIDC